MLNTIPILSTDPLWDQAKGHLRDLLGLPVPSEPFQAGGQMPAYFEAAYRMYKTTLMGLPCIALLDKSHGRWTPGAVAKHSLALRKLTRAEPIFVAKACSFQQRQRLIALRVGFVIPGNQVFLPSLGLELRERLLRAPAEQAKFSPATQVLVQRALVTHEWMFSPSKAAVLLGYTPMTLTRAFNELETSELARCWQKGRQRMLEFNCKGPELWEKAKPMLRSPVKSRAWIVADTPPNGCKAGLSALAELSDLAPPQSPCLAVSRKQWQAWAASHRKSFVLKEDPESSEAQIWWYPPETFAMAGRVDSFSLYLSLRPGQDERTEQALEQLEKHLW